jgi:hypothetical protein
MSARIHRLSDVARVGLVGAALLLAAASSGSNKRQGAATTPAQRFAAPAPRAMEADRAIGLWKSSFGPVKIERDPSGQGDRAVQGAWRYSRSGTEVIGLFWGAMRGNVLEFEWQEPGPGNLRGEGYLVFDPSGERFSGKWWTRSQDRYGDWNGWRPEPSDLNEAGQPGDDYGGDTYGGAPAEGDVAPEPPPPPPR